MSAGNWKEMFKAAEEGDLDLVEYHVEQGVDVNYVHPEILGTALVACILAKNEDVALYLLDHGADPNLVSDFEGLTPLQAARQAGLKPVVEKLLGMDAADVTEPVSTAASTAPPAAGGWFSRMWKRLG